MAASSLPPEFDWVGELQPLVSLGVLPSLPPPEELRTAADRVLRDHDTTWISTVTAKAKAGSSASASTSTPTAHGPKPGLIFPAKELLKSVLSVLPPGTPSRAATALFVASLLVEDKVRRHTTKAMLLAAYQARSDTEAAEAAKAAAGASEEDDGSGLEAHIAAMGSDDEVAKYLADVLKEPDHKVADLKRTLVKKGRQQVALALRNTLRAVRANDTSRADGTGSKTLGGVFFREISRLKAGADMRTAQSELPDLPPLRAYQADCVGMVLASWGLPLPFDHVTSHAAAAPAGEAARERYEAAGGDWYGNWLVSAPTNSGKTRIFIEITRGLLAGRPGGAVVVVLVPNVILTTQHATYFRRAGLPNTMVEVASSDNQLTPQRWALLTSAARRGQQYAAAAGAAGAGAGCGGQHLVVVSTAQSFANLLAARGGEGRGAGPAASLEQVDLLVLDEAHHCKEDHPYNKIMALYDADAAWENRHTTPASGAPAPRRPYPWVLGVTASPASEENQTTLALRVGVLLRRLAAQLHVLDEEHPELAAVLPEPRTLTHTCVLREVDRQFMEALQTFALDAAMDIAESLAECSTQGSVAKTNRDSALSGLLLAINSSSATCTEDALVVARLDPLGQWLATGRRLADDFGCPHLDLCCRLLDVLRKGVELVEDAGFEGALPFLARKAAALCREQAAADARGGSGGGRGRDLPAAPPATALRGLMFAAAANASAAAGGGSGKRGAASAAAAAEPKLLAELRAAAAAGPSVAAAEERAAAERLAAGKGPVPLPPGNRCSDVRLRVSHLVRRLLVGRPGEEAALQFLAGDEDGFGVDGRDDGAASHALQVVRDCFASGQLTEAHTFPKFWCLLQYLQKYRSQERFSGIVFVKTRQAVFYLADMIRRTRQLDFIEVLEMIGHNSSNNRSSLAPEKDRHGRGMNDTMQQQVLQLFKAPGRKLLIATSTAEEGMDVPSCEFVVRYNAAATGIQLLQSRGRARQKVSEFLVILQHGTQDEHLHRKSTVEEGNMRRYQQMAQQQQQQQTATTKKQKR